MYVRAWWQRSRHLHGTPREAMTAAEALDWADTGVNDQMLMGSPESAVTLVHRLLYAPGADPEAVAGIPLQDLLELRRPEVEQDVVGLYAQDPLWSKAMGFVTLTEEQRAAVPALIPYLGLGACVSSRV